MVERPDGKSEKQISNQQVAEEGETYGWEEISRLLMY